MEGHVTTEISNGVAVIEFFHPQSNSLPAAILEQLAEAITQADNDPRVIVMILRSKGEKAFCAGASFDELKLISNEEEGKHFFMGFARVINAMRRASKFIIGRVQGKCVGGGVGMAAAVDICFATVHADVKLSELAVGIGPFVVGPAVERKIGLSAFSQLAIQATEWRSAAWAREHGLFAGLYPDIQELDLAVDKLAQTLVESNPEAMKEMKKMFWTGTDHWDQLLPERAGISGRLVLDFAKYQK
jgi:enoyl-CoA hydratase/carnithine racemase